MREFKLPLPVFYFLSLGGLLLWGCNVEGPQTASENASIDGASWNLIFEDEFENLAAWDAWYGGAFNNEIQLYTKEQLNLEEGILKINALRKPVVGPSLPNDTTPKNFEYVSGRIESKDLYGPSDQDGEREYRFVARIKLPSGHGMWPAFWAYGDPWPTQGEIDILEARGSETDRFSSNIYFGPTNGVNINQDTESKHTIGQNLTEDFHLYEMIWRPNSIEILFDNEIVHAYEASRNNNIEQLLGKKQKIVFNTAVGGWFFRDQDANNYADSSTMEVDWVRVYKR
jgi:hypothetical protein